MRTTMAVLTLLLTAPAALAGGARVNFERIVAPPDVPSNVSDIAIVAAGPTDAPVDAFIDNLVDHASRSGVVRIRDSRRKAGPADAYLAVRSFQCDAAVRESEGSVRDADGRRVRKRMQLYGAVCFARVDVLSTVMKVASSFYAKGEGISSKVEVAGEEERSDALADAAHYAAVDAATHIMPRRVRESIELDESAPRFEEGKALIDASRLEEARRLWESELRREPRSASLHFDLAAICEALGDRKAAEAHYTTAKDLAPSEPRYRFELRAFSRRQ